MFESKELKAERARDLEFKRRTNKRFREINGYTWWTDIKTYFYLIVHPRIAIDLKYEEDLRYEANLRELKERLELGLTRLEYWAKVLGRS